MGAGKLLWGWYKEGVPPIWVPLQVDADGKVIVDMSAINLNDLADVSVATPTDGYILYWDDATSLWKCKAPTWLDLADTPTSFSGKAKLPVIVNDAESALTFGYRPLFSTATKTYYIDEASGSDDNDGESTGNAFQTWSKAETMIPIFTYHAYSIRIIGDLSTGITLSSRIPGAYLTIRGNTNVAADHEISGAITFYGIYGPLGLQYVRTLNVIKVESCIIRRVEGIYLCEPRYAGLTAIQIWGSIAGVRGCDFGTNVVRDAIRCDASRLMSYTNSGSCTRYGLMSWFGGTISKSNTQPTGATADENTAHGGVIR